MTAWKARLEETEGTLEQKRQHWDHQLQQLSGQLLFLEGQLRLEQRDINEQIESKDRIIREQQHQIQKLLIQNRHLKNLLMAYGKHKSAEIVGSQTSGNRSTGYVGKSVWDEHDPSRAKDQMNESSSENKTWGSKSLEQLNKSVEEVPGSLCDRGQLKKEGTECDSSTEQEKESIWPWEESSCNVKCTDQDEQGAGRDAQRSPGNPTEALSKKNAERAQQYIDEGQKNGRTGHAEYANDPKGSSQKEGTLTTCCKDMPEIENQTKINRSLGYITDKQKGVFGCDGRRPGNLKELLMMNTGTYDFTRSYDKKCRKTHNTKSLEDEHKEVFRKHSEESNTANKDMNIHRKEAKRSHYRRHTSGNMDLSMVRCYDKDPIGKKIVSNSAVDSEVLVPQASASQNSVNGGNLKVNLVGRLMKMHNMYQELDPQGEGCKTLYDEEDVVFYDRAGEDSTSGNQTEEDEVFCVPPSFEEAVVCNHIEGDIVFEHAAEGIVSHSQAAVDIFQNQTGIPQLVDKPLTTNTSVKTSVLPHSESSVIDHVKNPCGENKTLKSSEIEPDQHMFDLCQVKGQSYVGHVKVKNDVTPIKYQGHLGQVRGLQNMDNVKGQETMSEEKGQVDDVVSINVESAIPVQDLKALHTENKTYSIAKTTAQSPVANVLFCIDSSNKTVSTEVKEDGNDQANNSDNIHNDLQANSVATKLRDSVNYGLVVISKAHSEKDHGGNLPKFEDKTTGIESGDTGNYSNGTVTLQEPEQRSFRAPV